MDRSSIGALIGAVGGGLAVIGSAMPWLSFFGGLQPVTGWSGASGWAIGALGAGSIAGSVLAFSSKSRTGRWIAGLAGFAVLATGGWVGINLLSTYAALLANPLLVTRLEPGLPVALVGGALAFSVLFLEGAVREDPGPRADRSPTRRSATSTIGRVVLGALLGVPGLVHLAHASAHADGASWLAVALLGAGLTQLTLAAMIVAGASIRSLAPAIVVISLALVVSYVASVTVGLPGEGHTEHDGATGHGLVGHVESPSAVGLATGLAELAAAGCAIALARRLQRS